MNRTTLLVLSLLAGVGLTLLTGLFVQRSPLGATHFGYPLAWVVRMVVPPETNPWRIRWLGLGIDVLFWTVVVRIAVEVADSVRRLRT